MVSIYDDYSIIKFRPKHLPSIIKLYQESYGRSKPKKYFEHRLLSSPFGKPIIFLMKFHNQIVGFYAIHPIKLTIKNRKILGGYSFLTMTHPKHVGKGIFTTLASRTYQEAVKRKYNFVYGFANPNSYPGFIKKLGFTELGPINYLKIKKLSLKSMKIGKVQNHRFPRNASQIWLDYEDKDAFLVRVERNEKFLIWRYKKNPIFRYLTCYSPGKYFFIFKKYDKTLHIIDFFGVGDNFYRVLLQISFKQAKKMSCDDVTLWIPKRHPISNILKNVSIEKMNPKSFLILKVFNKKLVTTLQNFGNWYYTMGDADIF